MIYTRYMFTPGVDFDGEFIPKASPDDAKEVIEREGEGKPAFALMGFDPEGERWETLIVTHSPATLVRKVRMMFGIGIDWDGSAQIEFDRAAGIEAVEYLTGVGVRVRAWRGLMVGCRAAYADVGADWLRFEEVARRMGVTIKKLV